MRNFKKLICSTVLLAGMLASSVSMAVSTDKNVKPLYTNANHYIGTTIYSPKLIVPQHRALLNFHSNFYFGESFLGSQVQWPYNPDPALQPTPFFKELLQGFADWSAGRDTYIVDTGITIKGTGRRLPVHIHTLIYAAPFGLNPTWMYNLLNNPPYPTGDAFFSQYMEPWIKDWFKYIDSLNMDVKSIALTNENWNFFPDGDNKRENWDPLLAFDPDYVAKTARIVRKLKPNIKIFVSAPFDTVYSYDSRRAINPLSPAAILAEWDKMIDPLFKEGLIDGIAIEGHTTVVNGTQPEIDKQKLWRSLSVPDLDSWDKVLKWASSKGGLVYLSEFEVDTLPYGFEVDSNGSITGLPPDQDKYWISTFPCEGGIFCHDAVPTGSGFVPTEFLPDYLLQRQANYFEALIRDYEKIVPAKQRYAVTHWELDDAVTPDDFFIGTDGYGNPKLLFPTLFRGISVPYPQPNLPGFGNANTILDIIQKPAFDAVAKAYRTGSRNNN